MWSSDLTPIRSLVGVGGLLIFLASCTVEPLNATRSYSSLAGSGGSQSVRDIMKTISVKPVKTRVAQLVRNNLLFELNGGKLEPGGQYELRLQVKSGTRSLAVENNSLSPTSAQIAVTVDFELVDTTTRKEVSGGKRRAVASFDKTPQKFANDRAQRDAQIRAAKDVARQIRLAIGQSLAQI
ncbi:MAG: LPS assembly lipoprotein LptE [Rhizobiaceae bacterium]